MRGLKDLLDSERGVVFLLLLALTLVLVVVGALPVADWLTFTKWTVMTLVISKTVTGVAEMFKPGQPPPGALS